MSRGGRPARAAAPLALAALFAGAHGCGAPAGEDVADAPPVPVTCLPARAGAVTDRVSLRGVVAVPPDRYAVVAAGVAGKIVEVKVHEGDAVTAGQLLAVVEAPEVEAAVREADAARGAAKANVDAAEANLVRLRRLLDAGIAPRRELDDAEARRAGAGAELRAADARLELARRDQDKQRLRAPIAGVAVRVLRRAGELVDGTSATAVVEIADPATLEMRADAAGADLVRVPDHAEVEIHVDALPDVALRGHVVFVSPAVDPGSSLGVVRASIETAPPPGTRLTLGLSGELAVALATRAAAVLVPAAAVRRSSDGHEEVVVCARAGESVSAAVRPVKIGARAGADVEVASGLAAGEPVVVDHALGLADGTHLAPTP